MSIQRIYVSQLQQWQLKPNRKPLLIDGARQVGKSYLVEQLFGKLYYQKVLKLDFLKHPQLNAIFSHGLSPVDIMRNVQIATNQTFNVETDLLFFEEIGFSQQAMDALKYFHQDMGQVHLIATGSNIGLLARFPVGQIDRLMVHPVCFKEFLWANGLDLLAQCLDGINCDDITEHSHQLLWRQWLDFSYVGGMPAVVNEWIKQHQGKNILNCIASVRLTQQHLLDDYRNDFGKFSQGAPYTSTQIERVFDSIPRQIMSNIDGNAPKYTFKGVLGKRNVGYETLSGPIGFLAKIGLIHQLHIIEGKAHSPLGALKEENRFKVLLHDVGLLNAMVGLSYRQIAQQSADYKGFIAENMVFNEFIANLSFSRQKEVFSWQSRGKAELEFIVEDQQGHVIPIEVKSGQSVKSKSLSSFIQSQQPQQALKFTARRVTTHKQGLVQELPLYLSGYWFKATFLEPAAVKPAV